MLVSNSCSCCGDRPGSLGWGPAGAGHGLPSRGGRAAFVREGSGRFWQRVCKQLLARSGEVFGDRAARIPSKAGGQVSPKNKRQTHPQGEDFLLCWQKRDSEADPCWERGQIITSLWREMGSNQFLLSLVSLWLFSLDGSNLRWSV